MACGVPVVAFDNPWGHWILATARTRCSPSAPSTSLADQLERLCADHGAARAAVGAGAAGHRGRARRLGHGPRADLRLPVRPRRAARLTSGRGAGVLLVTPEPLVERMAGPAIRCLELARALARSDRVGPVTVASLTTAELEEPDVAVRPSTARPCAPWLPTRAPSSSRATCSGCTRGWPRRTSRWSSTPTTRSSSSSWSRPAGWGRPGGGRSSATACGHWTGSSAAPTSCCAPRRGSGRCGSATSVRSAGSTRSPTTPPTTSPAWWPSSRSASRRRRRARATGRGCTAALPGIGPEDDVVVWGGGVYDWFDPETVIRAVGRLAADRPRLRLLFLGTRHPAQGAWAPRRSRGHEPWPRSWICSTGSSPSTTTGCPTPSATSGWPRRPSG